MFPCILDELIQTRWIHIDFGVNNGGLPSSGADSAEVWHYHRLRLTSQLDGVNTQSKKRNIRGMCWSITKSGAGSKKTTHSSEPKVLLEVN